MYGQRDGQKDSKTILIDNHSALCYLVVTDIWKQLLDYKLSPSMGKNNFYCKDPISNLKLFLAPQAPQKPKNTPICAEVPTHARTLSLFLYFRIGISLTLSCLDCQYLLVFLDYHGKGFGIDSRPCYLHLNVVYSELGQLT